MNFEQFINNATRDLFNDQLIKLDNGNYGVGFHYDAPMLFYRPIQDDKIMWDVSRVAHLGYQKGEVCQVQYSFPCNYMEGVWQHWIMFHNQIGDMDIDDTDGEGLFDGFVRGVRDLCNPIFRKDIQITGNPDEKRILNTYMAMLADMFNPSHAEKWDIEDILHEDYGLPLLADVLEKADYWMKSVPLYANARQNVLDTILILDEL